jgi:hypothetical protein
MPETKLPEKNGVTAGTHLLDVRHLKMWFPRRSGAFARQRD